MRTAIQNVAPKKGLLSPDAAQKIITTVQDGIREHFANAEKARQAATAAAQSPAPPAPGPMFARQGGGQPSGADKPRGWAANGFKLPKAEG